LIKNPVAVVFIDFVAHIFIIIKNFGIHLATALRVAADGSPGGNKNV
jgi:hypothetical protein